MSQTAGKSEAAPSSAPEAASPRENKPAASEPVKRSLFLYSGFNKLFIGSLFGTMADRLYQMSLIAAANLIFSTSESVRQIVHIQIVATLPGLMLYAAAGSLVDTYDRRRLMMLIKAAKVVAVLLFVPLLWNASMITENESVKQQLEHLWPWCLGVVVLLNIISVPFSPSRAAAIPDVAPAEHRSLGASLMATTGLISFLVGPALGAILARGDVLGPAKTIIVVSIFYAIAAWLFGMLPDAVSVPGNKRADSIVKPVEEKATFKSYVRDLYEGLVYCLRHRNVLGLIFFETMFWTFGSAFYVLFLFHAGTALQFQGDAKTTFFGIGLACAGIGLFGGAIGVGKISNRVTPILTYPPAFLLIGGGLYYFFRSTPVDGHAPYWIYPDLFALGLGGGLLLGRVDADVLATTDASVRGRVFSLKAMCFAATTLATMLLITEAGLSDDQLRELERWLPRVMFICIPIAIVFSWLVDTAIWSNKAEMEWPGPFHRFGYRVFRVILLLTAKTIFRFRVEGTENIPKEGPVVLAANHGCYADPPLIGCAIDRIVQYIIYSSYYRSFAHPVFRFLRCIPVDEHDHLGALKATVKSLNSGACIGIFPEGRITYDGKMNPPQRGALFVAQRSGAMVVPVAIKGNFDAWPRTKIFPRFRRPLTLIYGKPFPVPKELTKKEVADLTDKLMSDIAQMLEVPPPPKTGEAPLESSSQPPKAS